MWVQPVGEEDPPEKEKTTHSSILAWKIPWKEEPGRLQCLGSQRVGHDLGTERIYMQRKSGGLILGNLFSLSAPQHLHLQAGEIISGSKACHESWMYQCR